MPFSCTILMYYTPLIYSLDHPLLDLSDFLGLQGCPYRGLKYREVQKSVVNNVSDTKQPESLKMDALAHNSFPPAPPYASLHRKIINDFVMLLNLQHLKKLDVQWVVNSP